MRNTAMLIIGSRHGRRDSGACPPLQRRLQPFLGSVSFPFPCVVVCALGRRVWWAGPCACRSSRRARPSLEKKTAAHTSNSR
jgi:hypothetical protein